MLFNFIKFLLYEVKIIYDNGTWENFQVHSSIPFPRQPCFVYTQVDSIEKRKFLELLGNPDSLC